MKRILGFAAAVVVLAGCPFDGPTGIEDTLMPGTVSFDFTGAGTTVSTRFDATGLVSYSAPAWGTAPIAVSQVNSGTPIHTSVVGGIPKVAAVTTWDQILLNLDRASVGSTNIPNICPGPAGACFLPSIVVEFGSNHGATVELPVYICTIQNGTMTITSIEDRRVTGTFSGTGTCANPANAITPFTVTNGVFDVGIVGTDKPLSKS